MNDKEDIEESICGETFDHDENITYSDPTVVQWECRRCGAEGWDYLDA